LQRRHHCAASHRSRQRSNSEDTETLAAPSSLRRQPSV